MCWKCGPFFLTGVGSDAFTVTILVVLLLGMTIVHVFALTSHSHSFINSFTHTFIHSVVSLTTGSIIISFREGHPVAAYVFFIIFPSLLSSLQWRVLEGSCYASCDQSNQPSFFFLLYLGYFSPHWLCVILPHFSHVGYNMQQNLNNRCICDRWSFCTWSVALWHTTIARNENETKLSGDVSATSAADAPQKSGGDFSRCVLRLLVLLINPLLIAVSNTWQLVHLASGRMGHETKRVVRHAARRRVAF